MVEAPFKSTGASKVMRIVLVLSLALNLAIAGLLIGAVASGRLSDGPTPNFDIGLGPIGRALNSDERRDIRHNLMRDGAMRQLNMRGRLDAMISIIQVEPYDPDMLQSLMAEQLAKTGQLQGKVHDVLLQIITNMTPERRAAFAMELRENKSHDRPPPPPQHNEGSPVEDGSSGG